MLRVINFFCVALMGLSILALYHVSEQTRMARVELRQTDKQIVVEQGKIAELQAQWEQAANPGRVQQLAQSSLGMSDTATVQLSSLTMLPRRGDDSEDLGGARNASVQQPSQQQPSPVIKAVVHGGM
jgi:cell division protein FtsL